MDPTQPSQGGNGSPSKPSGLSRKRSTSGTGGLLSKFPLMRSSERPVSRQNAQDPQPFAPSPFDTVPSSEQQNPHNSYVSSMSQVVAQQQQQQHKTRRRRGSLRKVALLGRGAQRERKEARPATSDIKQAGGTHLDGRGATSVPFPPLPDGQTALPGANSYGEYGGLGISDITPRPSMDGFTKLPTVAARTPLSESSTTSAAETQHDGHSSGEREPIAASPAISYSTTDDEDALHMGPRPVTPSSSSSVGLPHPYTVGTPSELRANTLHSALSG